MMLIRFKSHSLIAFRSSLRATLIPLLFVCQFLASCSAEPELMLQRDDGEFSLNIPQIIVTGRGINLDAVFPEVSINGTSLGAITRSSESTWSGTAFVPEGQASSFTVTWFETFSNSEGTPISLALATATVNIPASTTGTNINLSSVDYNDEGENIQGIEFDSDFDCVSNLMERNNNTDPFNPNDPANPNGEMVVCLNLTEETVAEEAEGLILEADGFNFVDSYQFLGLLNVVEITADNEVEVSGVFFRFASSVSGSELQNAFFPERDQCTVNDLGSGTTEMVPIAVLPVEIGTEVTPVSAGEVVPLTSASGTYVELTRRNANGSVFYLSDPIPIPGPIPSQLAASIPGDVFPAFGSVDLPEVESLDVTSPPPGSSVTPGTVFTWTAGTNPDAFVSILAFSIIGENVIEVECDVRDDGQFAFPVATQTEMGAGFSGSADLVRVAFSIQLQSGAALLLSTTSESEI